MPRLLLTLALAVPTAAAAAPRHATGVDPSYARANARLARATPHYPGARLLVDEPVGGEVGPIPFEAIQRVYFLARPETQRTVTRFYGRRLGPAWRRRGAACSVSGSRLVVTLVYPKRRRLGVLIDSRGAARCDDLAAMVGDLLDVGYLDP